MTALRIAPFLALLTLAGAGCGPSTPPPAEPPKAEMAAQTLVGAWRVRAQFTSGVFGTTKDLEWMTVFNVGGTMIESSNYDEAPPVPPAYGVWRAGSAGGLEAHYEFYTTKPPAGFESLKSGSGWLPAGHGEIHEKIRLAADGRSYDSDITLELFTADGHPAPGSGVGTAHATRIDF